MTDHPELLAALYNDEALAELEAIERRALAGMAPPSSILPSQWCQKNYWINKGPRQGYMVPDPYQVEIMDAFARPEVREIIVKKPQQIGWSAICNVFCFWSVDVHQDDVLMVQPSVDTAEKYAKERIEPGIESCQSLRDQLILPSAKHSGSTTRNKYFRSGGSIFVGSGSAPKELRSFSTGKIVLDERSGMAVDIGGEGDPGEIARGRGETYDDLTVLEGSTPAKPPGIDPIDTGYERSSKALFNVPCPFCNAMQPLWWRHPQNPKEYMLKFDYDGATRRVHPGSVRYKCMHCGKSIDESWKVRMVHAGTWIHRRPEIRTVLGYWLNSLYLVAKPNWDSLAQKWIDAQASPSKLRSFIHLQLAECFEEKGQSISPSWLRELANKDDRPRAVVPDGAALLIITCDVQTAAGGRLEAQVAAWFPNEAAVLVDHQTFAGDPLQRDVWEDFDAWRLAGWDHERGARMHAALALIDSSDGGTQDAVYAYCQPRMAEGVFPLKGTNSISAAGYAQDSFTRKNTIRFFLVATDATKQAVYSRLSQPVGQMRSIALPAWCSDEYLAQVCAEKRVRTENPKTGGVTFAWHKTRDRNEGLDLWSYQIAAWWVLTQILYPDLGGPNGQAYLEDLARQASESKEEVTYAEAPGRRIRSRGYVG